VAAEAEAAATAEAEAAAEMADAASTVAGMSLIGRPARPATCAAASTALSLSNLMKQSWDDESLAAVRRESDERSMAGGHGLLLTNNGRNLPTSMARRPGVPYSASLRSAVDRVTAPPHAPPHHASPPEPAQHRRLHHQEQQPPLLRMQGHQQGSSLELVRGDGFGPPGSAMGGDGVMGVMSYGDEEYGEAWVGDGGLQVMEEEEYALYDAVGPSATMSTVGIGSDITAVRPLDARANAAFREYKEFLKVSEPEVTTRHLGAHGRAL